VAADVTNQPGLLQAPGRLGDALAASSQRVGDELLGEQQFRRPHPVVCEQQAAAESLLDRVKAVADGGLKASPATCATARLGTVLPPIKRAIPTTPSLPTRPISAVAPSVMV
jgi:hypothetical protein